ncbi:MAG: DegQ family serine endoprotease [Deltaproteobacteria bacterium]|nr:DegQ family serine endoprotease [Deltaproteobacteria bacterium]
MNGILGANAKVVVVVLLLSLGFAHHGLTEASPRKETGSRDAATASKQPALPDFVTLAEKFGPVVVNISTTQIMEAPTPFGREDPLAEFWRRFFGESYPPDLRQQGLGSGFIIERDGTILTSNHVIENAQRIVVKLPKDEQQFTAKVIGRDEKTDLAVIKIDVTGDCPVAPLGDSDRLKVGEWVVAMGSPFGLQNTITAGIVSAKSRQIGAGPYDDFIQTDASINPGNSGGPLINMQGQVVGINTAIFSRTGGNIGIGFAIPINLARELLPELKTKGEVTRGWLGVSIQRVTPEIAESLGMETARGALVADVVAGSPAERGGIKVRDVIVDYSGKPIKDSSDLSLMVARTRVGTRVNITVWRDKRQLSLTATITELEEEEVAASAPEREKDFGLTVQNVTPEIAQALGVKQPQGVVITAVDRGSPADDAGLRRGDVILEIGRETIRNLAQYRHAIAGLKKGESYLFLVQRGQTTSFVALRIPREKAPS